MKYPQYPIITGNDPYIYEFYSKGPRGNIRKGVFYTPISENLCNLSFGNWNSELQNIDDKDRSNNGDRDQVLKTVASTAVIFTDKFPGTQLIIEGSTPARTRLYQMGIAHNILEINKNFEVSGLIDGDWESFQHSRNYQAFLITRK